MPLLMQPPDLSNGPDRSLPSPSEVDPLDRLFIIFYIAYHQYREPPMQPAASLDHVFAALANPTRRAMLDRLGQGEATVNELAAPFALSQPTISAHLRVLEAAGLVVRRRQANTRPVRLASTAMADAHRWLGGFEQHWTDSLERLEAYAKTLQDKD